MNKQVLYIVTEIFNGQPLWCLSWQRFCEQFTSNIFQQLQPPQSQDWKIYKPYRDTTCFFLLSSRWDVCMKNDISVTLYNVQFWDLYIKYQKTYYKIEILGGSRFPVLVKTVASQTAVSKISGPDLCSCLKLGFSCFSDVGSWTMLRKGMMKPPEETAG